MPEGGLGAGGLVAWLRVAQASRVFWCLGVVIVVAALGLLTCDHALVPYIQTRGRRA